MKPKLVISWSSGKDSAWTLHLLRQQNEYEITGLLTTVNQEFGRVAMHGVRREILQAQAAAAGLPLFEVPLPWPCSNQIYEERMRIAVQRLVDDGVSVMAFGDLFLEDIRAYREEKLNGSGITPIFPLWQRPTRELMQEMLAGGLCARIATLDPKRLPREFIGRELSLALLDELPAGCDPCAENGEFHTVAFAGPMFFGPIALRAGEVVEREGFVYQDFMVDEDNQRVAPHPGG